MVNLEIRQMLFAKNLKHWQVAKQLGISEGTFSRWLRYEMEPERKQLVVKAIKKLR